MDRYRARSTALSRVLRLPHRAGGRDLCRVHILVVQSTGETRISICQYRGEHYALSEYLPPINTGPRGETKPRKGQPKLAKQEILSVPPNPDNNHQTIVTPPNIKLKRDVSLPNMVAWTNIPGQPIAASQRQISQLKLPQFTPQVVEPTADVSKLKSQSKMAALEQPTVVEPKADVSQIKPKLTMPVLSQPSVVEPPLSPDQ